jgi:DNA repair exonuclease SbcCD nuclease subunit
MTPSQHLIGVVGDLHFYPDTQDPEKWEAVYDEMGDWIVSEFKKRGIRWVAFMGDVFHGKVRKEKDKSVNFQALNGIISFFRKFDKFENIVILGNHDCCYKESPDSHGLSIFDSWYNVRVVDTKPKFLYYPQGGEMKFEGEWDADDTLPINKFIFVPWGADVKDIPKADAIFGHFDIQTFRYNAHKASDHGFTSEQLFRRSETVVSGHYHHYQSRDYRKGNITYVGTPLQNNWGEADKESFVFVFDAQKSKLVERIENTISPKYVNVSLSDIINRKINPSEILPKNRIKLHVDTEIDDMKLEKFANVMRGFKMKSLEIDTSTPTMGVFDEDEVGKRIAGLDYRISLGEYIDSMPISESLRGVSKERGYKYYDDA